MNIRRNNGNDGGFIDDFVDFKKFVILEFQNINQKIANLNMNDQYPQAEDLIEQHGEWTGSNNSTKINRDYQKISTNHI